MSLPRADAPFYAFFFCAMRLSPSSPPRRLPTDAS